MTEKKTDPTDQQEIRVIDRRSFTASGERRTPDAVPDESRDHPEPTAAPGADRAGAAGAAAAGDAPVPSPPFQNLVLNLARQAAAHLGAAPSPLTGEIEVDLEAAQHIIALLTSLQQKTRGNLTLDENELLGGLIGDLQMQFVTVRSRAPKTS